MCAKLIRSGLKFTLYCETLSSFKNAVIYQRASRENPSIGDFSTRVISLKDADVIDSVFAKMLTACHDLLTPHIICNKHCECKSMMNEYRTGEYKEIVCKSWQKAKVAEFEKIQMYVQDDDRNGIEFVDVKGHPCPDSKISENEHLRTLVIDISEVVTFKKITFFEISKASALKFVNPNIFKLFDSLDDGVRFYSLENLRTIPYIPIPIGWELTVKRLLRLGLIKGRGKEICTNYDKLLNVNILIGKILLKIC